MMYNFFQKDALVHNVALYRKYGVKKKYFSTVSSKDFKHLPASSLIANTSSRIKETTLFKNQDANNQESMLGYDQKGYLILRNYLSEDKVDTLNQSIDQLIESGQVSFKYGKKIMFAIHLLPMLASIGYEQQLQELLNVLIDGEAKLFQSINFIMGSEQKTHSDSFHMTTYPLGGLLGVWLALDDIDESNGPLHYYPGSHLLPYYLNSDYDNEGNYFMIGKKTYKAYEAMIAKKIVQQGLKKEIFKAKKGDLLIWHANLFHGGEPHLDKTKTRKSVVFHFFKKDSICYHEITQRPTLMKKFQK